MSRIKRQDIKGIFTELSKDLNKAASRSNLISYEPHVKQKAFHESTAKVKLYIGGNRSGKTVGGCVEDIYWLKGEHPYRKVPPAPNKGRIIGVDFDNGINKILRPEIQRWIPPSLLINGSWEDSYNKGEKTLYLANGSFLEFMSYVQEVESFAGTSREFIHFDEEPPESIYPENKARVADTGGSQWFTMTPVEGMTWVYDQIYLPWLNKTSRNIDVIQVDITENPHISEEAIEDFLEGLDEDEIKARKSGQFVQMGGLAFKTFGPQHVIPSVDPRSLMGYRWMTSMDHGFNNPTAWLWHAIDADGRVITFHEHYARELTVAQHANIVKEYNNKVGRIPELNIGDPAIRQRQAVTGHSIQIEYINNGLAIALGNNNQRSGIDRMNKYLRHPDNYWTITEDCPNLIRQMGRLRWKRRSSAKLRKDHNPYEELHDKDNHSTDAARYFFTFMPDLTFKEDEDTLNKRQRETLNNIHSVLNPTSNNTYKYGMIDTNLGSEQGIETPWRTMEENLGGIW